MAPGAFSLFAPFLRRRTKKWVHQKLADIWHLEYALSCRRFKGVKSWKLKLVIAWQECIIPYFAYYAYSISKIYAITYSCRNPYRQKYIAYRQKYIVFRQKYIVYHHQVWKVGDRRPRTKTTGGRCWGTRPDQPQNCKKFALSVRSSVCLFIVSSIAKDLYQYVKSW